MLLIYVRRGYWESGQMGPNRVMFSADERKSEAPLQVPGSGIFFTLSDADAMIRVN